MQACLVCGHSSIPPKSTYCPACGSPIGGPEASHLPIGSLLDKYRIESVLGRGGFGITYKGVHTLLQQPVAIKEYFPEGAIRQGTRVIITQASAAQQELLQEGRLLAQLNHPSIVRVRDVFEANQTVYLVMDFVNGQTLAEIINRRGKIPEIEALGYIIQIAEALKVVHAAGLLHQDLKPDNLILTPEGRVVLIDFGATRQFVAQKTGNYDRVATPGYAPLEQYGSQVRRGPYTDIYGLGATFYALLTGTAPPAATDRVYAPGLPNLKGSPQVVEAIQKALSIKPVERPQSLEEFLGLLVTSTPAPPLPKPSEPTPLPVPSRPKRSSTSIFLVGLVALLSIGYYTILGNRQSSVSATSLANSTPAQAVEAPRLIRWFFDGCRSRIGETRLLVAGHNSRCVIRISYKPNGANPTRAFFTYTLKYRDGLGEHTLPVAGIDRWEGDQGNVRFSQETNTFIFDLPINVRERKDRIYHTIEVTGTIEFDNGAKRTIIEPLLIAYPAQTSNTPPNSQPATSSVQTNKPRPPAITNPGSVAGTKTPKFFQWYFSRCQSDDGESIILIAGRRSHCDLVVDYGGGDARPRMAVFSYTLEYKDQLGQIQELKLSGTDTWLPDGGNVTFVDSGSSYTFTLPLAVRVRPERIYERIVVVGSIFFDNGSKKNVLEPLSIVYMPN